MTITELIHELEKFRATLGDTEVIIRQPADYECIVKVRHLSVTDYGIGKCGGYIGKPSQYTKKVVLIQ
jgi:hypothetical protein